MLWAMALFGGSESRQQTTTDRGPWAVSPKQNGDAVCYPVIGGKQRFLRRREWPFWTGLF